MKMIVKLEVKLNLNQDIPNSKCESECVTNFYAACLWDKNVHVQGVQRNSLRFSISIFSA